MMLCDAADCRWMLVCGRMEETNEATKLVLFVWLWVEYEDWLSQSAVDLLDGGDNQMASSRVEAAGFPSLAVQAGPRRD